MTGVKILFFNCFGLKREAIEKRYGRKAGTYPEASGQTQKQDSLLIL